MALRDQPYIPLYVQDVLTDEKLIECSASSHGVYFRLLCILHKQEEYGLICLKQKYKQNSSKFSNFALMLSKQMPFDVKTITDALEELSGENVITIDDQSLFQKRMVRDGKLSLIRSEQGKKGGSNVTKQYDKVGYLYFMSDGYERHKIGVSVNPQHRLYRVRSDHNMPKHFTIIDTISVDNMGKSEDIAQEYFINDRDGEWLKGDYADIAKKFVQLKAKMQANGQAKVEANTESNSENEYENEYENITDIDSLSVDNNNSISTSKSNTRETKEKIDWDLLIEIFNSTCTSLPKITTLSESRKKTIRVWMADMPKDSDEIARTFQMAEESDFLSGRKTEWKANFDWLINPKNRIKVLEGNYANGNAQNKKDLIKGFWEASNGV